MGKYTRANYRIGIPIFLALVVIFVLMSQSSSQGDSMNQPATAIPGYVNREVYGDDWAFTVEEGVIECRAGDRVVLVHEGNVYAMNGLALGAAESEGWLPIQTIWRDNPVGPGPKIDLTPFINLGLELCK